MSTSWFVPKPHTAFQWEGQITREEYQRRVDLLRDALKKDRSITYNWHDPDTSWLEAVFSRGDRRLADVLEHAWERGAKMDAWSEHFDFPRWLTPWPPAGWTGTSTPPAAAPGRGVPLVPHRHHGHPGFLWREREKCYASQVTPDCRSKCSGCGANRLLKGGVCDG